MANLKNTSITDQGFLRVANGTTAQRPSSPVAGMLRFNTSVSSMEFYNGDTWLPFTFSGIAASSAEEIINLYPGAPDGVYTIDLPNVGPTPTYCLMDSAYDGGGWMLALKATRGTTFRHSSSYWTSNNTLNTGNLDRSDADAKFEVFNNFQGRDLLAIFPDIGPGGSISGLDNWTWLQNDYVSFISETTSTLLNLFNTADRTFIQDAKQYSGYGSAWSSQRDVRFYGFNYRDLGGRGSLARWGFGWNENGGGLFPGGNETSPDVSGGIGLAFGVNYSAGDRINCCQDSTGINRSARVEIYVR